jgi:hypothetical protein
MLKNSYILVFMEKKRRGRPPKYTQANEMELKINAYFESLGPEDVPTTAGLALHLGYADRRCLYDQPGRSEEFSLAIKRAIMQIEIFWEKALAKNGCTGAIFWLKNHKWRDQQEIKQEIDMGVRQIDTSTLTDQQKEALAQAAIKNMNLND